MLLEFYRKDGIGIFVGTICGVVLHLVGFGYESDGDTMGMLVAVLNSNFWLSTHVITITIGYGVTVVASMLGHLYLIRRFITPNDKKQLKKSPLPHPQKQRNNFFHKPLTLNTMV